MIVTYAGFSLATKSVALVVCIGLAGCGGSGSDERAVTDRPVGGIEATPAESLISTVAVGGALSSAEVQTWDEALAPIADTLFANEPITPWDSVPTTGSMDVYVGGVELLTDGNNRVFGTMNATTDFENGTIVGAAQNFHSDEGEGGAHTGTLRFSANFVRDNDLTNFFGIRGDLSGELTGNVISGLVSIDLDADFADEATIIYGSGTGTAGGQDVDANFVLSQN